MSQKPKSAHLAEAEKGCICNPMGWSRDSRCPVHGDSAPKPPNGPTGPCPDAEVCQRCPAAADDDVCFPCERLAAEIAGLQSALRGAERVLALLREYDPEPGTRRAWGVVSTVNSRHPSGLVDGGEVTLAHDEVLDALGEKS